MNREMRGLPQDLEQLREPKGVYRAPEEWLEGLARSIEEVMPKSGWDIPREWLISDHTERPFRKESLIIIPPQKAFVIQFQPPGGVQLFLNKVIIRPKDDFSTKYVNVTHAYDKIVYATPPDFQTTYFESISGEEEAAFTTEAFVYQKLVVPPGKTMKINIRNTAILGDILVDIIIWGWQVSMKRSPQCIP